LITQLFYIVVFVSRYFDVFWTPVFVRDASPFAGQRFLLVYNFCGKIFFIASSLYIVFLMMRVFARTREREKAWKLGMYCIVGPAVLATPVAAIFKGFPLENPYGFRFSQVRDFRTPTVCPAADHCP
jgi:ER lumen protein retaining receptor